MDEYKMQDGKVTCQMKGKIRKITILFEKVTFLNEMRLSKTRARELDMPHLALIHELKWNRLYLLSTTFTLYEALPRTDRGTALCAKTALAAQPTGIVIFAKQFT